MNIIIPIGGLGKRFSDLKYNLPKPLIKSLGKSIIIRCIKSLNVNKDDKIFIPYRSELDKYNFKDIITKNFNYNFEFIPIDFNTRGAAETVLIAINSMSKNDIEDLTIVIDSDNIYNDDIIGQIKQINDNLIFYFEDKNEKSLYSYIELNDDDLVINIAEKNKISNNACSGAYGFKNSKILKEYIIDTIKNNSKSNNEFYISTIYKKMIDNGVVIKSKLSKNYICLGTPEQLKMYSSNINSVEKLRFCFDLDNTLVTYPTIKNDYSSVKPITDNINYLKFLKSIGHTIIIYTARRMKTHNGDVGKVTRDIGLITLKTLDDFEIPYDEIYFGKPYADYYIDDLAVKSYDNLEEEIGFYNLHPESRKHNLIENKGDKITKYSNQIEGEKYWYLNIPNEIKYMFPELISHDEQSITINKIHGIPISYLNVNKLLTKDIILSILNSLNTIHNSIKISGNNTINIYSNYTEKIKDRVSQFNFDFYDNYENLIINLYDFFKKYENKNEGVQGVIHGDPVFTNILINNFDNLQFIDMRGKVGKKLTIYGDIFYDYSKVYQSIIGYDFILMDKEIDDGYIKVNSKIFEEFIINKFGQKIMDNIKWITKGLILSLIPIHNNEKCIKYYNLIKKI